MNLAECAFLTDENIHPGVVEFLRSKKLDVVTTEEAGLQGKSDESLLHVSHKQNRIVLTHDRDFGKLAIAQLQPLVGIIFLRPGHKDADFSIKTLTAIFNANIEVQPPFIIVGQKIGKEIRIRVRTVPHTNTL